MANHENLTILGSKADIPTDYAPQVLEAFQNAHPQRDYFVTLRCPEFTTLCPITGQPDFGTLLINYIPDRLLVESKSLKLYLFGFRNHGDFHEDVTNVVMQDLVDLMQPKYIEVKGLFVPRGGIAIHPFANWAAPQGPYGQMARQRLFEQLDLS